LVAEALVDTAVPFPVEAAADVADAAVVVVV